MRRLSIALGASLISASLLVAAADEPTTVGSVTEASGMPRLWGMVIQTPSILRITESRPVTPDTRIAIQQYDRVIALGAAAEPEVRAEAMRRASDLRVQMADAGEDPGGTELRKAIDTYRQLLAEQPQYPRNDRALYQLARAHELAGEEAPAVEALRQLGQRFPDSIRRGDAQFRAAELLFARGRYEDAEPEYRGVLALGATTPYFEIAQYKYGWALYKQADYQQAVPVFLAILERELPATDSVDAAAALAGVKKSRAEMTADALRVTGLSFAALGGGKAVNEHFARSGKEPRHSALIYASLGELLLEKQRYTEAASAYTAFVERHPAHAMAPEFTTRAISAYQQGGFGTLVVKAKEDYATRYAPGAPYWAGRTPSADVLSALRKHLDELGRHYQAQAQQTAPENAAVRKEAFIKAAGWYERTLTLFPKDAQAPETNLLYADALYDGGRTLDAARQYTQTAYSYGGYAKAPEAGYAAIQAYQRLATEVPATARADALRQSVAASLKLADSFPQDTRAATALTRAAEDLYELKDYEQAVAIASRVLAGSPPVTSELLRKSLAVVADSRYAQQKYPEAETAYTELMKFIDPDSPQRRLAVEQLGASVYKQAEAARDAGDLRLAASTFQRVGRVAPDASIRSGAEYDAASAFFALEDWPAAQAALENFRSRYPTHALAADADKKLALAYEKGGKPAPAAEAYSRIAARPTESNQTRRESAWLAAQLYDQAALPAAALRAHEFYLASFPQPLDRAMDSRKRLMELSRNDSVRYRYWLGEIVRADGAAGAGRSEKSKLMAAQASLDLGRIDAASARALALSLPLDKSLAQRKSATETAIGSLGRAAAYGYVDITTAAAHEIGSVYRDFGRALLQSQRPPKLAGDELEQYQILLEEQAYPFEEKAIQAYEVNLQRMRQGWWNESIRSSARALAELAPAKYGKNEQRESSYDSLQ